MPPRGRPCPEYDFSSYVEALVADHRRVPGCPCAEAPGASARHHLTDDLIAARDEDAERLGDGELANW